jgi:hypothetical protein
MRRDVIGGLSVFAVVLGIGFIVVGLLQHYVILAKVNHLAAYLVAFGALSALAGLVGLVIFLRSTNDGTRA